MTYFSKSTLLACALGALSLPSMASAVTFTLFTDEAAFNAAASNIVVEDFNGAQDFFAGNTTGNSIGTQTTLDIIGPGDSTDMGITGGGFLQLDVDAAGSDLAEYTLNTGSIFGFALNGIQDRNSTPNFNGSEVGVRFGGQSWLITDILGLTDSANATSNVSNTTIGSSFVGILSDTAFDSFDIVHGDLVAPFGVSGTTEDFWINSLSLATTNNVSAVPLPAGMVLLLSGLGALGVARRRKTA